jgi:DNA-binding IscR family transcriptional regulator
MQIVQAIDGDKTFKGCALGLEECNEEHPCPIHDKFKAVRDDLKYMLESTSLEELALDLKSGSAFLKI